MAESITWGKGRLDSFIGWITAELIDAQRARAPLEQVWVSWLEQYRAAAKQPERDFPYVGASNFIVPSTAIDVDSLFSKFLTTIHAPENLWTLQPLNERWIAAAKPLQDYLTWLDRNLLKMWNVNKRVILEATKLGTGIYKTGWLYERRPTWTYDAQGKRIKAEKVRGFPFADHVRLPDFLMPPYSYAIQPDAQGGAPWVAERIRVSPGRLRTMANATAPFLPNIDAETLERIVKYEEANQPPYDEAIQRNDLVKTGTGTQVNFDTAEVASSAQTTVSIRQVRDIELWEVHVRFGTKSADTEDDLVVWFHEPTRSIVRGVYQYYAHGQRPYDAIRYFPGEGFYGIGVCEQKEAFQLMASDLFNFTLDNVLLANSRMIVARAGANISPGEPIYPYKVWITDNDVRQDFGVFPMADIYPSLPMLSSQVQAMGERRTGISDIQLGNLQALPGRTPATTMLSLLQEGNRRPDLTIKDMRYEGLSTVGLRLLQLSQQFMGSVEDVGGRRLLQLAVQSLGMPEGKNAAEKLSTPLEDAALGVGVAITATSGSANKEVERQGYLALLQLSAQLGPQFIQLMQMATSMPGTPAGNEALQAARGMKELYARVLEQYDIRNPEQILPLAEAAQQGPPGANGGAPAPGAPAAGPAPVDAALAALFSGVQSGLR